MVTVRPTNVPALPGGAALLGHAAALAAVPPGGLAAWLAASAGAMQSRTFAFTLPACPTFHVVTDAACAEFVLRIERQSFARTQHAAHPTSAVPERPRGRAAAARAAAAWMLQRQHLADALGAPSFPRCVDAGFAAALPGLEARLAAAAAAGGCVDLHDLMHRFTLDSFGTIGFGVNPGCLAAEGRVPFAAALDDAGAAAASRGADPWWQLRERLGGRRAARARCWAAMRAWGRDALGAAAARRPPPATEPGAPPDLAAALQDACGSEAQLVDAVLNFIIAGRDTTAQALSWTFYELMRHPAAEAALVAEVRAALGDGGARPSYEQVRGLRFTRACFLEALRLHPPVPQTFRVASERVTLPDGSVVPRGGVLLLSPYVINRLPGFWGTDADDFRPERWLELEGEEPSAYSHLTWGAGPRACPARRAVEGPCVATVAAIAARFTLTPARRAADGGGGETPAGELVAPAARRRSTGHMGAAAVVEELLAHAGRLGLASTMRGLASTTSAQLVLAAAAIALIAWVLSGSGAAARHGRVPELPGGLPLLGHALEVLHNLPRIHDWLLESTRAMGHRTFSFAVPTLPRFFMVTDPASLEYVLKTHNDSFVKGKVFERNFGELLGHGIFTQDGASWLWQRKLATHIFSVRGFKQYINEVFGAKMEQLTAKLADAAAAGGCVDLHDLMHRFTLDSFGTIGFGVNPGCLAAEGRVPFAAAFDEAQVVSGRGAAARRAARGVSAAPPRGPCSGPACGGGAQIVNARFWVPLWPLVELLNGSRARLARDSTAVRRFAADIIATRRARLAAAAAAPAAAGDGAGEEAPPPSDLLSLFLDATGPDGRPLSEAQLVDAVLNFIIAGRDTTAQALSWTFYELMRHPAAEAALVAEVRAALGDGGARPSYEQVRGLRFTRACFLEALRLHPSVPEDVRYASRRHVLPDGSVIPRGGQVVYSPYVVNRLTSFWGDDADDFRPERWLSLEAMPSPYSYLTFNAGPRLCLGQRLAELEGVYVLAGLAGRFAFARAGPNPPGPRYTVASTLPMAGGLRVAVAERGRAD
ncbi:CYP704B1 [Scenedesmus sp. PABB004]|nr:CYP704B1 [Scenedesmus sp. PABB004]